MSVTGDRDAYFWSTHSGPELDLLVFSRGRRLGFEFKCSDTPEVTKSMQAALADLKLDGLWVVYPGSQSFAMSRKVDAVSILHLPERLHALCGVQP